MKIYHNPRCSKSRQTLAILEKEQIQTDIVEYLKTPPSPAELSDILDKLKLKPRQLLRKNEKEYTEKGLNDESLSDEDLIQAMCENPKLIERPIVVSDNKAILGRPPENVLELIK